MPFIISCEVSEREIPVLSITINLSSVEMMIGETIQLSATVTPSNATDKGVIWASSNSQIATVDDTGKINAIRRGESIIIAKAGELLSRCIVTVNHIPVSVEKFGV